MTFKKGRKKTGGRMKGVPNRLTAEIREAISIQVLRYFAPPQTYPAIDGVSGEYTDDMNFEHDMTFAHYARLRQMIQMARLVLPKPKDEQGTLFINPSPCKPIQCAPIVPRNEPKASTPLINTLCAKNDEATDKTDG